MEKIPYQLIRSRRKTLGLELRPEGLIVRAPLRATKGQIEYFVEQHRQWIIKSSWSGRSSRRRRFPL